LEQQVQIGEFIPSRENDILTAALGNPEHHGRTRGVGATVAWGKGLQLEKAKRRPRSLRGDELELLQAQLSVQQEQIERLTQTVTALSQRGIIGTDEHPSPGLKRSSAQSNIIVDLLDLIKVLNYNSILISNFIICVLICCNIYCLL
jgi:hypothetical protein